MGSLRKRRVSALENASRGAEKGSAEEREKRLRMLREGAEQCNDSHRRAVAIYRRSRLIDEYGGLEAVLAAGIDVSDDALSADAELPFVIAEDGSVFATRDGRRIESYREGTAEGAWRQHMEWVALDLVRRQDPLYTLDEQDRVLAPVGDLGHEVAIDPCKSMDLRALLGPETEAAMVEKSVHWQRFLAADVAADALDRLLELADVVKPCTDAPEAYVMSISKEYTEKETDVFADSPHKPTALFVDDGEREATRRLAWALIHNRDARALLSELTRRRDAFVG